MWFDIFRQLKYSPIVGLLECLHPIKKVTRPLGPQTLKTFEDLQPPTGSKIRQGDSTHWLLFFFHQPSCPPTAPEHRHPPCPITIHLDGLAIQRPLAEELGGLVWRRWSPSVICRTPKNPNQSREKDREKRNWSRRVPSKSFGHFPALFVFLSRLWRALLAIDVWSSTSIASIAYYSPSEPHRTRFCSPPRTDGSPRSCAACCALWKVNSADSPRLGGVRDRVTGEDGSKPTWSPPHDPPIRAIV